MAHLNSSPAVPGSNGVCGPSLPGTGMAFAGAPVSARWRSRCAEHGLRQAGCVAARPAAGCSKLQSSGCCGPTFPQVWPGMSSAGLEARRAGTDGIHCVRLRVVNLHSARSSALSGRRGSGDIRFMVRGERPKADHVVFLRFRVSREFCVGGLQSGLGRFSMGRSRIGSSEDSRTAGAAHPGASSRGHHVGQDAGHGVPPSGIGGVFGEFDERAGGEVASFDSRARRRCRAAKA